MAPGPSKKNKGKGVVADHAILEVIPHPVASVDLSDIQNLGKNYVECLKKIAEAASSDVCFTLVPEVGKKKVVPVTKGLDHTPQGKFAFKLTDGKSGILIVCDKYQLWMRGIVTENGSRYELDIVDKPKAMVNSKSLHNTGSYPHLLGGDSVHMCRIGYQSLLTALHVLAAYKGTTGKKEKDAIAVILVMFFEACRLQEVYDTCYRLLGNMSADEQVGETNKKLINSWSNTSRDFYEECGHAEGTEIKIAENTNAETKKVAKSVRILCRSPWDYWFEKNVPAVKWKPGGSSSHK